MSEMHIGEARGLEVKDEAAEFKRAEIKRAEAMKAAAAIKAAQVNSAKPVLGIVAGRDDQNR